MASFKDSTGKEWGFRISLAVLRRVEKAAGVKLEKLFDNKMEPLAALLGDIEKFVGVMWALIEKDAEKEGLTPELFAERIDGETLEGMEAAFWEGLTDFFPNRKAAMTRVRKKMMTLGAEQMEKAVSTLEGMSLEKLSAAEKLSGSSSNWQEKLESIRNPSAFGN